MNGNSSEASDEEILRASAKNPELFRVLVQRYEAPFMRKASSIVRVPEDAEEVVQDTFTRIYLYAGRYRAQEGASFSSWAYTILTRLAFTRYQRMKKQRLRTEPLDPEVYEMLRDQDDFVETLTIRDEALSALVRLPEAMRRVLTLQFLEGKSQEEIAKVDGSSVPAIKTRVHRAKKLLKEAYDKNHGN